MKYIHKKCKKLGGHSIQTFLFASIFTLVIALTLSSCDEKEVEPPYFGDLSEDCLGESYLGDWSVQVQRDNFDSLGQLEFSGITMLNSRLYSNGVGRERYYLYEDDEEYDFFTWIVACDPDVFIENTPAIGNDSITAPFGFYNTRQFSVHPNTDTLKVLTFNLYDDDTGLLDFRMIRTMTRQ